MDPIGLPSGGVQEFAVAALGAAIVLCLFWWWFHDKYLS